VILGVLTYIPLRMFAQQYTAFVLFEAKPAIEDSAVVGSSSAGGSGASSSIQEMGLFMQTQVADMLGESLRTQLAQHPTFRNQTEFAKEFAGKGGEYDAVDAVDAIEARLGAGVVPETTYIQLRFRAGTKNDAATIANTAANIYMSRLLQRTNARFEEALVSTTSRLRAAELQLRNKEQQMQRLLGDNQLESLEQRQTDAYMMVASLSPTIAETQNALESLQDRLRTFEEMRSSPEGIQFPEEVRTMVTQQPTIAFYDQQVGALRAELRTMRARFGANHLTVKQIDQRIDGMLDQKAAEEQRLLEEMFVTLIEATRTQIASLEAMLRESNAQRDQAVIRMQEITRAISEYTRLEAEADLLAKQIVEYRAELENTEALRNRTSTASRMQLVQDAAPPNEPSFPKIIIIVPVVTFLTVALVGGVIFLRELLEQRVRMPADVQMINRARLLGVVPDIGEDPSRPASVDVAVRERPDGVIAEQVRQIRTSIAKARGAHEGGYAILVVGGMPGAGASSIIAALAQSYAAMGDRTLVIDANLRKPLMHQYLSLADAPGLSDCLAGSSTLDQAAQKMTGDYPVHLLAAGAKSSRVYERLNSQRMTDLIVEARGKYDVVLIDAPPMVVSSDAIVLASKADASILIVKAFQETRGLIGRVVSQLSETRAQHLGIIVNGVKAAAGGYYRRNFRLAHRYNAGAGAE
ncbi:MAG: polysaccharide biosynthesis tyrosine autokinase, partial [Phycisphaerales bacterium]